MESTLTKRQVKVYGPKPIEDWGTGALIKAEVRYDDECGNGHNTFSITGEIYIPKKRDCEAGGCLHEEIAKAFPELAPFIKWHLVSSDGPMHYPGNALYLAGERDCWGKLKGEPNGTETVITFGQNPIKHELPRKFIQFLKDAKPHPGREGYDFEVLPLEHDRKSPGDYKFKPKYTFGGFAEKWHECPFDSEQEALDFLYALQHCEPKFVTVVTSWGEGKARELDAARSAAVWPDATDDDLTGPGLKERLESRLPELLREFRRDVESLGFVY